MNAKELAEKFSAKVAAAGAEKDRQITVSNDNRDKRLVDVEHCKRAMTDNVIPFLSKLKSHLLGEQFSFAPQTGLQDHKVVRVSFRIGDGPATMIYGFWKCDRDACGRK